MKLLIIDTYYPSALNSLRKNSPQIFRLSYQKQLKVLLSKRFGTSDAYSYYLKPLKVAAHEVIANDEKLQRTWAKEHKITIPESTILSSIKTIPYIYRFVGKPKWMQDIILAQVTDFKPTIIYFQDLTVLNPDNLKLVHARYKLVGQIASMPPPVSYLKHFDLLLTSLPNLVEKFTTMGIKSRLFKIGFDQRILAKIGEHRRVFDTVFVGSFSTYHTSGTKLLEKIAHHVSVDVWGNGLHFLSPLSPLRRNFHGEAWGITMYEVLARAKIVVNRHSDIAGEYANNMRMYEATGMGALLITEERKNLSELFAPGKEIVTYIDSSDLLDKLRYYLVHEDERIKIAQKGQERTHKEHTYEKRMKELECILKKEL